MNFRKSALAGLSLIVTAFALFIGLAGPASAAPACEGGYPPAQCTVQLSSNVVAPGGTLSFSADGFQAGETVIATVHSAPIQVGTFEANSDGVVSGTVTIPTSLDPGRHTLTLTGTASGVVKSSNFTVTAAAAAGAPGVGHNSGGTLAFTGMQVVSFLGAAAVLIVAGSLLLVVSRRRRSTAPLGA